MERASERAQAGALLGAAVLAVGMAMPLSTAGAGTPPEAMGLFQPGAACGPAETLVGTTGGLLARVRAEAGMRAPRKPSVDRPGARRPGAQQQRRPGSEAPRRFAEAEPRPALLRSFYTCDAAPNYAEGTGWRLVGPLRRS